MFFFFVAGLRFTLTRGEQCRVARITGCWRNRNLLDLCLLTGWELLADLKLTRTPGKCPTPICLLSRLLDADLFSWFAYADPLPGNKASCEAFNRAMDNTELQNYLEDMYAANLNARKTVVDPQSQPLSQSEMEVVMLMPHHSHLATAGQTVVLPESRAERGAARGSRADATLEKDSERVAAQRREIQRERTVAPKDPLPLRLWSLRTCRDLSLWAPPRVFSRSSGGKTMPTKVMKRTTRCPLGSVNKRRRSKALRS